MPSATALDEDAAIYSPRQIYVASFIGSPMAAAWFMSLNYRALSRPEKVRQTLVLGGAATLAAFAIAYLLPERTPNIVWPLAYSLGIYHYAKQLFGGLYETHVANGRRKGSWWRVIGIALLFSVAIIALIFAIVLLFPAMFEP